MNGYWSRSGAKVKKAFEGGQMSLWRRLPKRGFNNYRDATRYEIINVDDLNRFPEGSTVGWKELHEAGFLQGRLGCIQVQSGGRPGREPAVQNGRPFVAEPAE